MRRIIFGLVALLCVASVLGIGITPGKLEINYQPGVTMTETITIINNELKESHVALYVDEKHANIISFQENVIDLASTDSNRRIDVEIKIPDSGLDYGENIFSIIATEFPFRKEDLEMKVGSLQAVVSQIIINVPYPGKYIDADFVIVSKDIKEPIAFLLKAKNKGQEDIKEARANIEIFGPTNEPITTVVTDKKEIQKGKMRELVAYYNHDLSPGKYYAKAVINYDNEVLEKELIFDVGEKSITVTGVTTGEYALGDIAKFQVWLKSNWNGVIEDVYGDMVIKDSYGKTLTSYTTVEIDIEPFATQFIEAYWDTAGVSEGKYPSKFVVHYMGENIESSFNVMVEKDRITTDFREAPVANVIDEQEGGEPPAMDKGTLILIVVVFSMFLNTALVLYFIKKK